MDHQFKPSSYPPQGGEPITDASTPLKIEAKLKDGVSGKTATVEAWAITWTKGQVLVVWREGAAVRQAWVEPGLVRRVRT